MPLQEHCRCALTWLLLIAPLTLRAAEPGDPRVADEETVKALELGAVTVQGAPVADDAQQVPARTVIDREQLQRFQPDSIFDAMQGVPGVSVNGGPRTSGMKFNIRGYSDNEDVLFKIDGATKGFEKYRFGGGAFIEPDLLKQVEVTRGPTLLDGSGALGGTVSATTKDAADFLLPGRNLGARAKAGYADNNNEWLGSVTVYGRPNARVDMLGSFVRRNSGDITLPNGTALRDSSTDATSALLKGTVAPSDTSTVTASFVSLDDTGLQAFDATAGQPGLFGTVRRTVNDRTFTINGVYEPGNRWVALRGTLGYSQTHIKDVCRPGQCSASPATGRDGNVTDEYDYDIWSYDLRNSSRFATGQVQHELTVAAQGVDNTRDVTRVTQNPGTNNSQYPNGFYAAQPPGTKRSLGLVLQDTLAYGNFTVTPGMRWDQYEVIAAGGTKQILDRYDEPSSLRYTHWSPALALTWRPRRSAWLLSASYVEAFRPPLIDEAFTQGPFSRCLSGLPWIRPAGRQSNICGSAYRPEESQNYQVSAAYSPLAEPIPGLQLNGRLTLFRSNVQHTLESIQNVNGTLQQPGTEYRQGLEFELNARYRWLWGTASYSQIEGEMYDGRITQDLYDIPGNTLVLQLGVWLFGDRLNAGWRYRHVASRTAIVGTGPGNMLAPGYRPLLGTQPSYQVNDVFARFQPNPQLELSLAVENIFNETYYLDDGFGGGIGSQAPGRNIKGAISVQF